MWYVIRRCETAPPVSIPAGPLTEGSKTCFSLRAQNEVEYEFWE